ncbi:MULTISPECIES: hypothetical protein [unclassified Streptomyces]|uniref:hypothetical protein n=1 Tax=unclassified Streptomyces TaxID=2593676 RepID=UPI00344FD31F
MRTTALTAVAVLAAALTACSNSDSGDAKDTASSTPSVDIAAAEKAAGIPPIPTGTKRQQLLDALAEVNPGVAAYEDKAIDAARNQCGALNSHTARPDLTASQRFSYRGVTTTEAQGKQINEALTSLGFCKV